MATAELTNPADAPEAFRNRAAGRKGRVSTVFHRERLARLASY